MRMPICCRLLQQRISFTHSRKYSESKETHFGFETVSTEEKSEKVSSVFSNVASRYDLMNDVMSGGVHRLWKDKFISVLHPTPGTKLIDVAGGTGDIAFRFLKFVESYPNHSYKIGHTRTDSHVTVCDFNEEMLKVGQSRAENLDLNRRISWVQSDAQNLPFQDNSFDAYTIAFGIRNVTNVSSALKEAYRVLRPGGCFMCLEFSQVDPVLSKFYDYYSFQVIPVMGMLVARDWKSYQYLVESIRMFPNQDEFKTMIEDVGFRNVSYTNLFFGVTCIHSGFKL